MNDDLAPLHLDPPYALVPAEKLERGEVIIPLDMRADLAHGFQWGYEGNGPYFVVEKVVVDENHSSVYKKALSPGEEIDPDIEAFWDEAEDTYTVWVRRIMNSDAWRRKGAKAKLTESLMYLYESVEQGQSIALVVGDIDIPVPLGVYRRDSRVSRK
jgi:hypothetical protein